MKEKEKALDMLSSELENEKKRRKEMSAKFAEMAEETKRENKAIEQIRRATKELEKRKREEAVRQAKLRPPPKKDTEIDVIPTKQPRSKPQRLQTPKAAPEKPAPAAVERQAGEMLKSVRTMEQRELERQLKLESEQKMMKELPCISLTMWTRYSSLCFRGMNV